MADTSSDGSRSGQPLLDAHLDASTSVGTAEIESSGGRFASLAAVMTIVVMAALAFVLLRHPVAPEVNFTTIKGEKFDTASLKGKVVLVNFWATSCLYCMHEMPGVVDTYRRLHDQGLDVVAVAMPYDPPNSVVDYANSRQLPFPVALDMNGTAAKKCGEIDATPTTVVIDRSGHIVAKYIGELDFEPLSAFLEKELAKPAAST
jgi:peroxiredoxin